MNMLRMVRSSVQKDLTGGVGQHRDGEEQKPSTGQIFLSRPQWTGPALGRYNFSDVGGRPCIPILEIQTSGQPRYYNALMFTPFQGNRPWLWSCLGMPRTQRSAGTEQAVFNELRLSNSPLHSEETFGLYLDCLALWFKKVLVRK